MADEEKISAAAAAKPARELTALERRVIFIAGVTALLLLVLHFPFDGYNTDCNVDTLDLLSACFMGREDGVAPIWYWQSLGALVPQLAPLKLLIVWEAVVVLIALAVVFLFREKGKAKPQP